MICSVCNDVPPCQKPGPASLSELPVLVVVIAAFPVLGSLVTRADCRRSSICRFRLNLASSPLLLAGQLSDLCPCSPQWKHSNDENVRFWPVLNPE
jgi:hypothetical protein